MEVPVTSGGILVFLTAPCQPSTFDSLSGSLLAGVGTTPRVIQGARQAVGEL